MLKQHIKLRMRACEIFITQVKQMCLHIGEYLKSDTIIVDFEIGMVNVLHMEFRDSKGSGCYFH